MNKFQLLIIAVFAAIVGIQQLQINALFNQLGKAQLASDMSAARAVEKFERDLFDRQQASERKAAEIGKAFGADVTHSMNQLNALAPDYTICRI